MKDQEVIRQYYDANALKEWNRLENNGRMRPEFAITARYIERYVRPGDTVLDLGGGPGRYSLHMAAMGARVTLADLSQGNVDLARQMARQRGLPLHAVQADALEALPFEAQSFDHVLCMGPLYHLLDLAQRRRCVSNALAVLKPGGCLFAAFIQNIAGVLYYLQHDPTLILNDSPAEVEFRAAVAARQDYSGDAFTRAHFSTQADALALFEGLPLTRLHFLGCEGILAPNEALILGQETPVYNAWLDYAAQLCEHPELLAYSEHLMYIGRKA